MHLAPAIVQQIYGPVKELDVIALDPELERLVTQALNSPHGAALDPGVADTLTRQAAEQRAPQEDLGVPACLLVPDLIRAPMARLLKRAAPRLKVLSHSEIPETHSIRIGSIIGASRMNVKRFTARTSRDALTLVRQAFGEDAVVLSTRPCAEGVEVLAMAPDGVQQIERVMAEPGAAPAPAAALPMPVLRRPVLPAARVPVDDEPSRSRCWRAHHGRAGRGRAVDEHAVLPGLRARAHAAPPPCRAAGPGTGADAMPRRPRRVPPSCRRVRRRRVPGCCACVPRPAVPSRRDRRHRCCTRRWPTPPPARPLPATARQRHAADAGELMNELRAMKGLIEDRFGALAFMEKLQRQPRQAQLTQRLLD